MWTAVWDKALRVFSRSSWKLYKVYGTVPVQTVQQPLEYSAGAAGNFTKFKVQEQYRQYNSLDSFQQGQLEALQSSRYRNSTDSTPALRVFSRGIWKLYKVHGTGTVQTVRVRDRECGMRELL